MRARWKKRKGGVLVLKPSPKLKPITLDIFERGCYLIGVDPDKFLAGKDVLSKYPEIPLANSDDFLRLVLRNYESFRDWKQWPLDVSQTVLALIAANFLIASRGKSRLSMRTLWALRLLLHITQWRKKRAMRQQPFASN